VYISKVVIYDDKQYWDIAHVRIGDQDADNLGDEYWPHVDLLGLGGYWSISNHIYLPRTFLGYKPNHPYYYRTIVHELGHYVFAFDDEYGYRNWIGQLIEYSNIDWNSLMTWNIFFMSYGLWYGYWLRKHPDLTPPAQWQRYHRSCWEWFVKFISLEKNLIDFDLEAYSVLYIPYAAQIYYNINPNAVDINYFFSEETYWWYLQTFLDIYLTFTPNVDITQVMEVIIHDQ